MSKWLEVAEKRGAMHAANEKLWIVIERDEANGDDSLQVELDVARKHKTAADLEYITARRAAVASGERHPNEVT